MTEFADFTLLLLIFLFYGVGDVVTTLYGMRKYDMSEANPITAHVLGATFPWYNSIALKLVTLVVVLLIYYISRVLYTSTLYQTLWWILALLILFRGFQVTVENWQNIRAAQRHNNE
jgi:hypothetical protein